MSSSKSNFTGRRKFLKFLSAPLGLSFIGMVHAQDRPCPPIIQGGAERACDPSVEDDWIFRSTGPGVQWAHNFRSDEEVTYWLWVNGLGDDPERQTSDGQLVVRDITDGVSGGGCLKITRLQGNDDPGNWWRPMSPMQESGRGEPDVGWTNGMPTINNPRQGDAVRIARWGDGNYGPASTGDWDGNEYYLQLRVKLDPRRRDDETQGGKIMYLTRTERSLTAQEIVTYYRGSSPHQFGLYKAGSPPIPSSLEGFDHVYDEWVTLLFHVIAGDENQPNSTISVWRALQGEQSYTKIYEAENESINYEDSYNKAWNAVLLSAYHNGIEMVEFWQKYDEIIFSKDFIPAPAN